MNEERINQLSTKLLSGNITPTEWQELDEWYNSFDDTEYLISSSLNKQQFSERVYNQIAHKAGLKAVKRINYYRYAAAAASLLLFLTAGIYYILHLNRKGPEIFAGQQLTDIRPGGNKATLTLANGKTIDLESAAKGILPTGGERTVNKKADGYIAYDNADKAGDHSDYNTLTTPRGGKFSIKLADGTLAILDAGSSIRYPSVFNSEKRTVEVTGQVYFEVVHHSKQPFLVKVGRQTIEDLGTHFNINAYPNASGEIKTTLEEGRVSIANNKEQVFLKPGQVALSRADNNISVAQADLEEALAWKNGYFRFNDEHIENIMSQISRWYDIEVVYTGKMPADGFNGTISRSKNISQVLKMLERTRVIHFKIEGRRITVLP
jgi:transmembrane sensor